MMSSLGRAIPVCFRKLWMFLPEITLGCIFGAIAWTVRSYTHAYEGAIWRETVIIYQVYGWSVAGLAAAQLFWKHKIVSLILAAMVVLSCLLLLIDLFIAIHQDVFPKEAIGLLWVLLPPMLLISGLACIMPVKYFKGKV